jgi:inner membrane protein
MNGPTHQFAGAIVALAITQTDANDKTSMLHHPAVAIALGAFLGRLPDMIEPSLGNPNHRQFFHSAAILGLLGIGIHKLYNRDPQSELDKLIRGLLLLAGSAYISHLVLDSLTSRSLPILGKL